MLLKLGSTGENVTKLQKLLNVSQTGTFDEETLSAVKKYQKDNNLTVDGIVGNITWTGLTIVKSPLSVHVSKCSKRIPKYLAIHYTAGGSSKSGRALGCKSTFEKRQASADFAVDDENIVQFNPDINKYYCWAVGDGNGKYGITNKNSISIEICSNLTKGTSASKANHSGWYFTDEELNLTLYLTKFLMQKYNIDKDHVVRHYDASRKLCPGLVGWNTGKLYNTDGTATKQLNTEEKWLAFKAKL